MSATLKERFFVQSFWDELGTNLQLILPGFDGKAFQKSVCDANWPSLELKQRIRSVAVMLRPYLAASYADAVAQLVKLAQHRLDHRSSGHGFAFLFLADFIEEFGLDHLEASVKAIPVITQVMSCEFAVRPFLIRYPNEMMAQMLVWADHPNVHVRRLASEGSRPRLPWGMALQFLKKDPSPCLPILEKLKDDPEEYVRRSVANHLNDISKDHPDVALKLAQSWIGKSKETDRLLKHALRGLLKAGNETALGLFGFVTLKNVAVQGLRCQKTVAIGGDWEFSFELVVGGVAPQHLRLEFGIDYMKANGKANRKIFQLREATFSPGTYAMSKRHSFLERTTRKHHIGLHAVAVLVNGVELGLAEFEVTA
jgi:3-methyladenine DNA glycosylase AlkC